MRKQSLCKNWKPLWDRFVACAVLGLYTFALIVLPALHGHGCEVNADTCCEHSDTDSTLPVQDDSCSICEFAWLTVPFCMIDEPLLSQADICSEISYTISLPSVADGTLLPPCRAPPVL